MRYVYVVGCTERSEARRGSHAPRRGKSHRAVCRRESARYVDEKTRGRKFKACPRELSRSRYVVSVPRRVSAI